MKLHEKKHYIEKGIIFTHLWVDGFGWENTIYGVEDFIKCNCIGTNGNDKIYHCVNDRNIPVIIKGYFVD